MTSRARAVLAIVGLAAAIVFVYLVNFSPRVSVDMETNSTVVIECDPIGAAFSSFWVLISNGGAIDASVVQGQDAVDRKQRMWTQEGIKDPFFVQRELDRGCTNRRTAIGTMASLPGALAVTLLSLAIVFPAG